MPAGWPATSSSMPWRSRKASTPGLCLLLKQGNSYNGAASAATVLLAGALLLHKAKENSEVANLLMGWGHPDGAANRLYYAMYHAGWAFLVDRGRMVPAQRGRRYFRHDQMGELLNAEGFAGLLGLPTDWGVNWEHLRNLRVKADYFRDSVRLEDLDDELVDFVSSIIREVGRL